MRACTRMSAWIAVVGAAWLSASPPAQAHLSGDRARSPGEFAAAQPEDRAVGVPRMESAAAQLAYAAERRLALRGTEGDARRAAREAAVAAYRGVREHFPGEARACAEAAFRAGELLRAADDVPGALSEFTIARDRGANTPFRVRGMLEIGHVERRARNHAGAVAAYEGVVAEADAPRGIRDEASLWLGRVYSDLDRVADARRVWKRVADDAADPLDRVRAFDYLASALVGGGDLNGAAEVLQRCRDGLADVSAEETKLGERVRAALLAMRAGDELERARAMRAAKTTDSRGGG